MEDNQIDASTIPDLPEATSLTNESRRTGRLFSTGRLFLGLIAAGYVLYLAVAVYSEVYAYNFFVSQGASPHIRYQPILFAFITLILLVADIFLIRKSPFIIGAQLCGLGVVSILLMFIYIPIDWEDKGVVSLIYCLPVYWFLFLLGAYIVRETRGK